MELIEPMLSSSAFSSPLSGYRKILKRQDRAICRTAKFPAVEEFLAPRRGAIGREEDFRSQRLLCRFPACAAGATKAGQDTGSSLFAVVAIVSAEDQDELRQALT